MRNNSAVSIQKVFASRSRGRYCVRGARPVPLCGRAWQRAVSLQAPPTARRECSAGGERCGAGTLRGPRWECLRGRLKSRYNRSYICICEENFLYSILQQCCADPLGVFPLSRRGRRKTFLLQLLLCDWRAHCCVNNGLSHRRRGRCNTTPATNIFSHGRICISFIIKKNAQHYPILSFNRTCVETGFVLLCQCYGSRSSGSQ